MYVTGDIILVHIHTYYVLYLGYYTVTANSTSIDPCVCLRRRHGARRRTSTSSYDIIPVPGTYLVYQYQGLFTTTCATARNTGDAADAAVVHAWYE